MRNILVFPDGSRTSFMYPENREVTIGESVQAQMKDDSIHVLKIKSIEPLDKEILYHLNYS